MLWKPCMPGCLTWRRPAAYVSLDVNYRDSIFSWRTKIDYEQYSELVLFGQLTKVLQTCCGMCEHTANDSMHLRTIAFSSAQNCIIRDMAGRQPYALRGSLQPFQVC